MPQPELKTPETTFDDLADIERDWCRGIYVEFTRRNAMLRYARLGLALEMLSESAQGPIAGELKRLIRTVDAPRTNRNDESRTNA